MKLMLSKIAIAKLLLIWSITEMGAFIHMDYKIISELANDSIPIARVILIIVLIISTILITRMQLKENKIRKKIGKKNGHSKKASGKN